MRRGLFILFLAAAVAADAHAEDRIWAALVLGSNGKCDKPTPEELQPFIPCLQSVFGYESYYLLADKAEKIRQGTEEWIIPRKKVFLKVRCLSRDAASYTVALEFYVRKKLVVSSEVRLARGAPLYIRGPNWGKGRLVFILEVR